MPLSQPQREEISRNYVEKFNHRFFEIVKLADRGDDKGYGKGLARLQNDIEKYLLQTLDQELDRRESQARHEAMAEVDIQVILKSFLENKKHE